MTRLPTIRPEWDIIEGVYVADDLVAADRAGFVATVRRRYPQGAVIEFSDTDAYLPSEPRRTADFSDRSR